MKEPEITFTRSEFVAFVQKIQDLALMGAFIFIKDMTNDCVEAVEQGRTPHFIREQKIKNA